MAQLDKVQTKNREFIGIRVVLDEIKKWKKDNQTPHKIYCG
jgi:hypothetical protein